MPADIQNVINKSFEAMKKAYAPYSKFPVGAAIMSVDGSIFTGRLLLSFYVYLLVSFKDFQIVVMFLKNILKI